jgi:histidinol-phosphate phosphatase family protein
MKKAVFIDRDGTINEEKGYLNNLGDFLLFEKTHKALKALKKAGYKLILITNQSGLSTGMVELKNLNKIHRKMIKELKASGAELDDIYVCPHSPEDNCECRKPKTKLVFEAKEKYGLNLKDCWVIGDKTSDIEMGKRAGCRTVLLKTGYGGKDGKYAVTPDFVAEDIFQASKIIKKNKRKIINDITLDFDDHWKKKVTFKKSNQQKKSREVWKRVMKAINSLHYLCEQKGYPLVMKMNESNRGYHIACYGLPISFRKSLEIRKRLGDDRMRIKYDGNTKRIANVLFSFKKVKWLNRKKEDRKIPTMKELTDSLIKNLEKEMPEIKEDRK